MPSQSFDPRAEYNKTSDSQVTYTGPKLGGVESGTLLSSILPTLISLVDKVTALDTRIKSLEQKSIDVSSDTILANSLLYDLIDQSQAVNHTVTDQPISLAVVPNSTGRVDLNFDFMEAIAGIDSKYVPVSIDTSVRTLTGNKLLGSSGAKKDTITISSTTEPLLVTSKINLKSADGDVVLSKTFYLPTNQPADLTGKFQPAGTASSEVKEFSQREYNEVLASNVSKLQKSLDNLNSKLTSLEQGL